MPYAIAAKFAHPHRPVIALVGDGAMQMNGNAELVTIAKYWERWHDPRLIVLVLNNRDLNQVTWEQRAMAGDPKFEGSQSLPDFPYASYAEMIGLRGIRVDDPGARRLGLGRGARRRPAGRLRGGHRPARCRRCRRTSRSSRRSALMSALRKGDPNAGAVIRQSFKQKVAEFLPGR